MVIITRRPFTFLIWLYEFMSSKLNNLIDWLITYRFGLIQDFKLNPRHPVPILNAKFVNTGDIFRVREVDVEHASKDVASLRGMERQGLAIKTQV